MRGSIIIFLLSLAGLTAYSQACFISTHYEFYKDIDMTVKVFVENCSCDSLILTTDNGVLKFSGRCQYSITPKRYGNTNLTLKKISKGDTIIACTRDINSTTQYPRPEIKINNEDRVSIDVKDLINPIIYAYDDTDFPTCYITGYKILIEKHDRIIYKESVKGNFGTDRLAKFVRHNNVKGGAVILYDIEAVRMQFDQKDQKYILVREYIIRE